MEFLFYFIFVSDVELEELIQEIVQASDRGVSAVNNVSGEPNWSFGQSLFFASTVVTTIGKIYNQLLLRIIFVFPISCNT